MNADLFPETLLVDVAEGHAFTTSLKVAEHFHKRHKNVIQSIEIVVCEVAKLGRDRLNFQPISYRDAMNREQKMYRMDRLAFTVLANRFTGTKALAWQLDYHWQFEHMERQLAELTARYARTLDRVRPKLRPVVEGTEAGLCRTAIAAPLGASANAISYHRRAARQMGLLAQKGG